MRGGTKEEAGRLTISNLHLIRGGSPLHSVVGGEHREGIWLPKEPTVGGSRQITRSHVGEGEKGSLATLPTCS